MLRANGPADSGEESKQSPDEELNERQSKATEEASTKEHKSNKRMDEEDEDEEEDEEMPAATKPTLRSASAKIKGKQQEEDIPSLHRIPSHPFPPLALSAVTPAADGSQSSETCDNEDVSKALDGPPANTQPILGEPDASHENQASRSGQSGGNRVEPDDSPSSTWVANLIQRDDLFKGCPEHCRKHLQPDKSRVQNNNGDGLVLCQQHQQLIYIPLCLCVLCSDAPQLLLHQLRERVVPEVHGGLGQLS